MINFDDYIDCENSPELTEYELPENVDEISIELDNGRANIKINGVMLPIFNDSGDYRDCLIKIYRDN